MLVCVGADTRYGEEADFKYANIYGHDIAVFKDNSIKNRIPPVKFYVSHVYFLLIRCISLMAHFTLKATLYASFIHTHIYNKGYFFKYKTDIL